MRGGIIDHYKRTHQQDNLRGNFGCYEAFCHFARVCPHGTTLFICVGSESLISPLVKIVLNPYCILM